MARGMSKSAAPYNPDACGDAGDLLLGMVINFSCRDSDGRFSITFDYPRASSEDINPALSSVFPSEGGQYGNINGFNCPGL